MWKSTLLLIGLTFLLPAFLPCGAQAENARIRITLYEVPVEPEIKTQVYVSWGAHMANPPANYLHRHDFTSNAGRSTGTVKYTTSTRDVDPKVTSFIVYGLIRASSGDIIRVIPAKLFFINDESLTQLEVAITPRRSFSDAFLDSYPLEFWKDEGFLNGETVRPTLRSFRLMIDYAGETDSNISPEEWKRLYSFFKVNRSFFKRGGSQELSEILQYLKTFVAASRGEGVASFYAEFLNGLVPIRTGLIVFDKDLTDYIHGQLMQLYETRLPECFHQANLSLQAFHEARQYDKCVTLAEKILKSLNGEYLQDACTRSPKNLFSTLVQCTICGQDYYATFSNEAAANRKKVSSGARFLVQSEVSRPMISEYQRIFEVMESHKLVTFRSTGEAAQLGKYYIAYNCALRGNW